jgi:hypothetical protein
MIDTGPKPEGQSDHRYQEDRKRPWSNYDGKIKNKGRNSWKAERGGAVFGPL